MTSAAAALLGVGEWLDTIGLSEYKDVFEEEGYDDIAVVSELTEADLDVLRITKRGTRKKLLMKAKALKATIITKVDPVEKLIEARRRSVVAGYGTLLIPTLAKGSELDMEKRSQADTPTNTRLRKNSDVIERLTCLEEDDSSENGEEGDQDQGEKLEHSGKEDLPSEEPRTQSEPEKAKEEEGDDDVRREEDGLNEETSRKEAEEEQRSDRKEQRDETTSEDALRPLPPLPSPVVPIEESTEAVVAQEDAHGAGQDSREGEMIEVMEDDGKRQKLLLSDRAFSFQRTMQMWQTGAPLASTASAPSPTSVRSRAVTVSVGRLNRSSFEAPPSPSLPKESRRSPNLESSPYRSPSPSSYTPVRSPKMVSLPYMHLPLPPPPPVHARRLRSMTFSENPLASFLSTEPSAPWRSNQSDEQEVRSIPRPPEASPLASTYRNPMKPSKSVSSPAFSGEHDHQRTETSASDLKELEKQAQSSPDSSYEPNGVVADGRPEMSPQEGESLTQTLPEESDKRGTSLPTSVVASPHVNSTVVDPLSQELSSKALKKKERKEKKEKKKKKSKREKKRAKKQKKGSKKDTSSAPTSRASSIIPSDLSPPQPPETAAAEEPQRNEQASLPQVSEPSHQEEKDLIKKHDIATSFDPIPSIPESEDQQPTKPEKEYEDPEAEVFESKVNELVRKMREAMTSSNGRQGSPGSVSSRSSGTSSNEDEERLKRTRDKGKEKALSDDDLSDLSTDRHPPPIPPRRIASQTSNTRNINNRLSPRRFEDSSESNDDESLDEAERRRMRASVAKMRRARRTESVGSDSEAEIERFWRTRSTDGESGRRRRDEIQLLPKYQRDQAPSTHSNPRHRKPMLLDVDLELTRNRHQLLLDVEDDQRHHKHHVPERATAENRTKSGPLHESQGLRKHSNTGRFTREAKSSSASLALERRDVNIIGRPSRAALLLDSSSQSSSSEEVIFADQDTESSDSRDFNAGRGAKPRPRSSQLKKTRNHRHGFYQDDDDSNVELHYDHPQRKRHSSRSARIPSIKYDLTKLQKENEDISKREAEGKHGKSEKKGRHGLLHKLFFSNLAENGSEKKKTKEEKRKKTAADEIEIGHHAQLHGIGKSSVGKSGLFLLSPRRRRESEEEEPVEPITKTKKQSGRRSSSQRIKRNDDDKISWSKRKKETNKQKKDHNKSKPRHHRATIPPRTISEDLMHREQALAMELKTATEVMDRHRSQRDRAPVQQESVHVQQEEQLRRMADEIRKLKEEVAALSREERELKSAKRRPRPHSVHPAYVPSPKVVPPVNTNSFEQADDERDDTSDVDDSTDDTLDILDDDPEDVQLMMRRSRTQANRQTHGSDAAQKVAAGKIVRRRNPPVPARWDSNLPNVTDVKNDSSSGSGSDSQESSAELPHQTNGGNNKAGLSFWF